MKQVFIKVILALSMILAPMLSLPPAVSAAPAADTWSAFSHQGIDGGASCLAAVGTDLFVGGNYTGTYDGDLMTLGHIAKYDTVTGTWAPLAHNGVNKWVWSCTVIGTDLYIGGDFTSTADGAITNLDHIARYNTLTGVWSPLAHLGLNAEVNSLAVMGTDLYAGGVFNSSGDGTLPGLNSIARYDTLADSWSALAHSGLSTGGVGSLTVIGSSLYVGGTFTQTSDGAVTGLNSIAVYKGGAWSALAHGGLASTGGQATVWASTANGSDLYVGGAFTRTADGVLTGLNCIAWYNTLTGAWSPLSHYGLDKMVFSLAAGGGNLYVGGWLTKTADGAVTGLNSFATYNLAAGIWMAPANQGLTVFSPPASVLAILPIGNTLYAGGYFDRTMDGTVTNMAGVASLPIPKLVTGPYHDYLPTLTR